MRVCGRRCALAAVARAREQAGVVQRNPNPQVFPDPGNPARKVGPAEVARPNKGAGDIAPTLQVRGGRVLLARVLCK